MLHVVLAGEKGDRGTQKKLKDRRSFADNSTILVAKYKKIQRSTIK